MQALVWEAPSRMVMHEVEKPVPGTGEVLIEVAYAGICGSELSGYLGHSSLRVPPLVMGHEFSGKIVQLGPGLDRAKIGLRIGQSVTVNPLSQCGQCSYCRRGDGHLCGQRRVLGAHLPGAYATYVAVPITQVTALPMGLSLREGALTEPVACAVRIGEMAGDVSGKECLVIGAGPIGLLAMQVLFFNGAKRVFMADLSTERSAMAAELDATVIDPHTRDVVEVVREQTGGAGVAVSVDAVGLAITRGQSVAATHSGGTLILSGLHQEVSEMPAADIIRREIVVRGSFAYAPRNFVRALELLDQGVVGLDPWIVEAPLRDGGHWFDRLLDEPGDVSKVLLTPG
jgi:2-desacetyl-2-hydroxyethyl bacteriochlorophyllide A dehydrogenase